MNRDYLPLTELARKTVDAYKDDDCQVENCEDCRLKLRRRIVDVEITRSVLQIVEQIDQVLTVSISETVRECI